MSYTAAETGRVKSIKSKFENLNSLESLDISVTVPHKYRKPSPSFLFKRSSTSIDLPVRRIAVPNNRLSPTKSPPSHSDNESKKTTPLSHLQRHNHLDRTVSADTVIVKKRNFTINDDDDDDTLKPLKEIKENVEVRLQRHINDPVKRSSIKRSPAFRVGEKNNSCSNSKNVTKSNRNDNVNGTVSEVVPPVVPKEFAEKFESLLKRCDIEGKQQMDETGLSDTLKAFLRQPLPSGPPPKKPPRTFIDSPKQVQKPASSDNDDETVEKEKTKNRVPAVVTSNTPTNSERQSSMRQKIDRLENQLVLKTNINRKVKSTRTTTAKEKLNPFSSSLLNCIPCSSASIYDTMITGPNQFGKVMRSNESTTSDEQKFNKLSKNARTKQSEPIYMEPFAHLKNYNGKIPNGCSIPTNSKHGANHFAIISPTTPPSSHHFNSTEPKLLSSSLSNGSFDGPESLGSSLTSTSCTSCTADDHSITDLHDIHYMCTSIENKIKSSDSDSASNENDQPLPNTYDEINILVNAAFGQHKSSDSMGNTNDSLQVSPSISHTLSPSNAESGSQQQQQQQQRSTTIKLSRTLTEKRKDYVRRVSAVKQMQPDNILTNDSLHQTFKPSVFRTFSVDNNTDDETNHNDSIVSNLSEKSSKQSKNGGANDDWRSIDRNGNNHSKSDDNDKIDMDDMVDGSSPEKISIDSAAIDDVESIDNTPKLFQVCLLIGFNNSTRQAYIKTKFPSDEDVPPNIEQLVFPSPNLINQTRKNQDYSIILTDTNGYHVYGYCRRILPESCDICLPLAYCIISEVKAPGFYFKILREIETRHGQAEFQTNFLLQSLQTRSIPSAGKFLHLKLPLSPRPKTISSTHHKITPKRLSLEVNPKWLTESAAQAAFSNCESVSVTDSMPSKKERSNAKSLVQEFEEKKQQNNGAPFDLSLINRSLFNGKTNGKCDEIFIRRPNDLRLESTELSDLYQAMGPDLLIVVFSTLLLERKVILYTENISILSSCVLGLQTLLYPFQWQHTIITILPESLVDICQAPIPVLAGLLEPINFDIEDGIVIDLNTRTLVQKCGDETTILPNSLSHSLKVSLEMVNLLQEGKMLSSVLIAEAFLRCFVELFVGYKYSHFDKKLFIESHSSQSYRFFLEWFVETAMFRHFVHQKFTQKDMANSESTVTSMEWMGESKFYDLFDSRIMKNENESHSTQQNMEMIMKNCKVINKKGKTFKDRFKDFISSNSSSSNNN